MGTHSKELPRRNRLTRYFAPFLAGVSLTAAVVVPNIVSHATERAKNTVSTSVKTIPQAAKENEKGVEPQDTTRKIEKMGSAIVGFARLAHEEDGLPVHTSFGGKFLSFTLNETKGGPTQYSVKFGKTIETKNGIDPVANSITMMSETVHDKAGSQILALNRLPEIKKWDVSVITNGDNSEEDILWEKDKAGFDTEQYGKPISHTYNEKIVSSNFNYILHIISDNVDIVNKYKHILQAQEPDHITLASYQAEATDNYALAA